MRFSSDSRTCCRLPASTPPSTEAIRKWPIALRFPKQLYAEGVRRYGFHGLSYEYIAQRLREVAPEIAKGRVVVAHLGSGASMCALAGGKSVESTMGFTALDGLPMGTRPGQLDAGVVLYLMSEKGDERRRRSSAFSTTTAASRVCRASATTCASLLASADPRAKLALEYFVYRIALFTGMLAAAMSGIDGFVFTAGIGENAPAIREAVMRGDSRGSASSSPPKRMQRANCMISRKRSRVACYVIPTDEELMIATTRCVSLRAQAATRAQGETRMIDLSSLALLKGKKALVTGIANDQSIAWGCAKAFHAFGADVAITYLNEKSQEIRRSARQGGQGAASSCRSMFSSEGQLEAVFESIEKKWGKLDLCLHSIAFAPKADLQGRVVDCSKDGFLLAMELSCWSFIRMAKLAEPLMKDGGDSVHDDLLRLADGGRELQHDGAGEGGAEVGDPLYRSRTRTEGHQGARNFPRSPEDPRGFRDQRLRQAPAKGSVEGASAQSRLDRRRRRRRRLPRHEWGEADHRRDALHRRRLSHHRLATSEELMPFSLSSIEIGSSRICLFQIGSFRASSRREQGVWSYSCISCTCEEITSSASVASMT